MMDSRETQELINYEGNNGRNRESPLRANATLVVAVLILLVAIVAGSITLTTFMNLKKYQSMVVDLNVTLPINLQMAKAAVIAYMENGQYDDDMNALTNEWWAYFAKRPAGPKDVVVFDIDDTVLSSYRNMKSVNFGYISKESEKYQLDADAPVIPQTEMLFHKLVAANYTIVFLTGRNESLRNATAKNLERCTLTQYMQLILRGPNQQWPMTAQVYKTAERKILSDAGYNIVGTIGDQWSDISGDYAGYRMKVINYCYFLP